MEHKHLSLEVKATDEGLIEGYGAVFGNVDNGGDVIAPGAFSASLASGRKIKMLRQHDPDQVIGVWDHVAEDANGLRVKGRILLTTTRGRDAFEEVKAGAMDGLSIGYRTLAAGRDGGNRLIQKADLWEVSMVTFPMNELARVDAVKAAEMTERELERMLTRDAGLSRSVAQRLMAGGYDAVKAMRDAGESADEVMAALRRRLNL